MSSDVDNHVQAIGRTYDSLGRVTKVTSYAGTTTASTVRNEVETVYNALGQVTQSYQAHGGATSGSSPSVQYAYDTSAVSNVYDDALRPTSTTYPNGTRQILYHYGSSGGRSDLLSRMEKIQEGSTDLTQYAYNGIGRLVNTKLLPPGVESLTGTSSSNFSYLDQWGRVRQTRWFKSSTSSHVDSVLYTYDRAGNRLQRDVQMNLINNSFTDERDQTYEYDLLNRLKSADQKAGSTVKLKQAWGLDQLGNWSAFQQDGKNDYSAVYNNSYADTADLDQTRKHNAVNEIDNDNDHANSPSGTIANGSGQSAWALPAYDASGNMTSMPKPKALGSNYTVKYDAWNRLSTVADGSTVIQTNRYDGLHRRVSRESNTTGVRHFYWNEQWQCVEERLDASTTADRQYVWHPYYIDALAISYNSSGTAHYYVQDGNFNVTAAMDSSGAVVERYSYTPYGECIVLNADFTLDSSSGGDGLSDISNEFTYTGRRLDVETGLYQYRHRYYHAQLGRFVNRDPIGYAGGWNQLIYVGASPVSKLDPSGLATCTPKLTSTTHGATWVEHNPILKSGFFYSYYEGWQEFAWSATDSSLVSVSTIAIDSYYDPLPPVAPPGIGAIPSGYRAASTNVTCSITCHRNGNSCDIGILCSAQPNAGGITDSWLVPGTGDRGSEAVVSTSAWSKTQNNSVGDVNIVHEAVFLQTMAGFETSYAIDAALEPFGVGGGVSGGVTLIHPEQTTSTPVPSKKSLGFQWKCECK